MREVRNEVSLIRDDPWPEEVEGQGGQAGISNAGGAGDIEGRRNRSSGYKEVVRKCCLVDRDHFRPVVSAERNPVAWQPQPQNISTGRWLSGGWRDDKGEVRGGGWEGLMDTY